MSAKVISLVPHYVVLSAVCVNCETTWTAILKESSYEKYVKKNAKAICPCCGHTEVGLAKE